MQHRDDALAVMDIRRRDVDRQREAVFIDGEMDLDALDLLATIEAAREATRRRVTLSMMTALGTGLSPQTCRQARIKRLSRRRHSPSRVQRANSVYSVPNGMSQSWPIARHCRPQNPTHQIAMIALCNAAPVSGGSERVDRVPSVAMAASSASTASTKASTSENASHEGTVKRLGVKQPWPYR